jgi:RHS repeat-associated protein
LTSTYYANDMVASLTQLVDNGAGGTTTKANTYTLDPGGRVDTVTTTTGGAETQRLAYKYADTTDAPTGIATSTNQGTNWTNTRYLSAPGLGMVGVATTVGDWQLTNLHGDIVATQPNTTGATTLSSYTETDEYGNTLTGTPGRYGYLGAHQRSTDTVGGLTLMGARLYNPASGSFASQDRVMDGGETKTGYPSDPVNRDDISGEIDLLWHTYHYDTISRYHHKYYTFVVFGRWSTWAIAEFGIIPTIAADIRAAISGAIVLGIVVGSSLAILYQAKVAASNNQCLLVGWMHASRIHWYSPPPYRYGGVSRTSWNCFGMQP